MAWLSEENVPVINVSLVGPRNRIVEAIARTYTPGAGASALWAVAVTSTRP